MTKRMLERIHREVINVYRRTMPCYDLRLLWGDLDLDSPHNPAITNALRLLATPGIRVKQWKLTATERAMLMQVTGQDQMLLGLPVVER